MVEKKDTTETVEIEEKRIKPAVIRRRSKGASAVAQDKAKEAPGPEAEAKEKAKAKVEDKKPEKATARKTTARKKAAAKAETAKKEPKKATARKGATAVKKMAVARAKAETKPAKAGAKAPKAVPMKKAAAKPELKKAPPKKEVKVFGKEEVKKPFPSRQVFRKGKLYEVKEARRKSQAPQPTRPLLKTEITVTKAEKRVIRIAEAISVADLSQRLGVKASEIIKKLMGLGIMATVNQFIDVDAATLVAQDFDYEVESIAVQEESLLEAELEGAEPGEFSARPPVVTVMGHVDHGKTSLLDAIRKTSVVSGEAGGITQHIGAYHAHLDKGDITFLDTPGHEAFTAMRARGAKVTDIVVLVVAADDGVMPQTVEAINHAKAANVPIIVAINKVDLPQAEPDRIKQALTEYGLVQEEWGGETLFVEVSAKKGTGIKDLLEIILLQSEMLELKAAEKRPANGVIVEAKLDKGRGPVSTVLIRSGTLKTGDSFVTGLCSGRVRAMISDWGHRITEAGPSMPVEILGLSGVPQAGDDFTVVRDEAAARQIASIRQRKTQEEALTKSAKVSLSELYEQINRGEVKELGLIVKGDVQGSIEALIDALNKITSDAVSLKVIHSAVGGINEGDVMLASASNAIVLGFNVRPETKAKTLAEKEGVDIRLYNVIYNLVDDIKNAMEGLLEPVISEETLGRAEVREVFRVSKVGNVAGSYVTDGKIARGAKVRLLRDNVVIFEGDLASLKRFKEDAKEVATGYECGISIAGYNDIKAGDVIEAYTLKEVAAKL
jgi:translation initiation factor IF-2